MATAMAFVLCPHFGLPPADDFGRAWRAKVGGLPIDVTRGPNGSIGGTLGAFKFAFVSARGRIPTGEEKAAITFSVARHFGYEPPAEYDHHVIVTIDGPGEQSTHELIDALMSLSSVLCDQLNASGLYVGRAPVTNPGKYVVELLEKRLSRTPLWCGVSEARPASEPAVVSLVTIGLHQLGLSELELRCLPQGVKEGVKRALDFAGSVAKLGRDFAEGETWGDVNDPLPVVFRPSPMRAGQRVMFLDLTKPAAK